MPRSWLILPGLIVAFGIWYAIWSALMAGDVARVKATIDYHDAAFKAANAHTELKADAVSATGFPFSFRVKVVRLTLSMIWEKQTFAVSIPEMELTKTNSDEGRYRVTLPAPVLDALYATDGTAPEKYRVTLSDVPPVLLRAQGPNVRKDDPLVSFAVALPERLTLTATLNGVSKNIGFAFIPMDVPVFTSIPKDAANPLELFVGMLREALIYNGK